MAELKMILKLLILSHCLHSEFVFCHPVAHPPNNYCKFSPNHTLCHYKLEGNSCGDNFKSERVTDEQKVFILDLHNQLRSNLALGKEKLGQPGPQPPAANMMEMEWDEELAMISQTHVNQCIFGHQCINCSRVDRFDVGQNIYKSFSSTFQDKVDWEKAIRKWYSEVKEFGNNQVSPYVYSSETGHYTQIMWWNTRRVGCGASRFERKSWWMTLYSCSYGPMGNRFLSQLYSIGFACSGCPKDTACSVEYPGLCKISPGVNGDNNFPTDLESKAIADKDYLKTAFPKLYARYTFLKNQNPVMSYASQLFRTIPLHVVRYLDFFANESVPRSFEMVSKFDPMDSDEVRVPPTRISSDVGQLDFLLVEELKRQPTLILEEHPSFKKQKTL